MTSEGVSDRNWPILVHVWSGPRCLSTSLMYSFAQRADVGRVEDEPLYAAYLNTHPDVARPPGYRELVLQSQNTDASAVAASILEYSNPEKPILYAKHMAKQRAGAPRSLLASGRHALLVRRPEAVVASFSEVTAPDLHETCLPALLELYSEIRTLTGTPPPIILSEDLIADPEGTLRALCAALDISFDPAMLSWPAEPKPDIDGVWAPWWYAGTWKATGFGSNSGDGAGGSSSSAAAGLVPPSDPALRALLDECRPLYEFLRRRALRPASLAPPSALPAAAASPSSTSVVHSGTGTHAHAPDPRNADVLVGMRDGVSRRFELVWRPDARVSVLDSAFMLGDGVWEGLRVHKGRVLFARDHIDRLYEGAAALDMDLELSKGELLVLVRATLEANGMAGKDTTGVHVRLMVSRGLKSTPYQHPGVTIGAPLVVILPEWKRAAAGPTARGIRLFTVHVRRGAPDVQDPGWNSHSKLNCIAACIQAAKAGADEALMLDPRGFVATCNSTNFFIVRRGEVWAPGPGHQLRGITRQKVLDLCGSKGIVARECDFYLTQVYSADEAFVTGTFGGLTPVVEVDGRRIGSGQRGPVTERLQAAYKALCETEAARAEAEGELGES